MTTVEGKGRVAPRPVQVGLSTSDLSYLKSVADKRESHRKYASGSSAWKRGFRKDAILTGLVGEFALQQFLRSRRIKCEIVDETLNNGDGGRDATIANACYQVKTSARAYPTCLVRRCDNRLRPYVADRFVFCRWQDGEFYCDIRGWCDTSTLRECGRLKKAKRGTHFNTELDESHLLPINDLVMLIKQEVELG